MIDALEFLRTTYALDLAARLPIEIPNTNRETLAQIFGALGFTRGVEVGVERGMYSDTLLRHNTRLRLSCVDAWQAYRGYRDHVDQDKLDRFFQETQERLRPYADRVRFIRKFSVEAAKDIPNASLDFVYLDGNHNFQHVVADLAAWTPKVKPGGIIAGHDYALHRWPNQIHVVQAVKGWTAAYDIAPWFVLGSQAKVEGQLRDDARSFFWVHQPRPVLKRGEKIKQ